MINTTIRKMYQINTPETHKAPIMRENGLEDYEVLANNAICNGVNGTGWLEFQFWQTRMIGEDKVAEVLVWVSKQEDMYGNEWTVKPCYGDKRSECIYGFRECSITRNELEQLYIAQLKSKIRELVIKTL